MLKENQKYIQRALDLAVLGIGNVAPNPMVGCVIVCDAEIIGEGYHRKCGETHAEVNAIKSVKNKELLKKSILYVTLEPCSHFGKTPPCADLIIQSEIPKVVICNKDPNPLVAGNGILKLQKAGIEVVSGVLEQKGETLNKRFFHFMRNKKPYVILKWAATADGFVARENYSSKWISNWLSRKMVHKWRAEETAIMVGTNTAFYDNPSLNVRDWEGKNPLRIVLDAKLRLPKNLNLFDGKQTTICYNFCKDEVANENLIYKKIEKENIENQILTDLFERNIQSIIIEGGRQLLQGFINKSLWQEARVFKSFNTFESGIPAPKIKGNCIHSEEVLDNTLSVFMNGNLE